MAGGLSDWYGSLYSRTVDLVGDYAGAELFLVEGDSLLLEAFSDPHLDFKDGSFQLLHATFNVEAFLKRLVVRKCNFHVAFFDDHEDLCVPSSANEVHRAKYLLARAAIIRHLQQNVSEQAIPVHVFPTLTEPKFLEYLKDTGCYFVMCHDGTDAEAEAKAQFQWMIHFIIQRGWNIALTNGLECHDTKVRASSLY